MPTANKRPKLLSSSRPPAKISVSATPTSSTTSTSPSSPSSTATAKLSSKRTRSVIRTHHTLQKQLAQATAAGDADRVRQLETQLQANGGLTLYQAASTAGQGRERGGDTSGVLVAWLRDSEGVLPRPRRLGHSNALEDGGGGGVKKYASADAAAPPLLRILEVGALSPHNALNIPGVTSVRRIDLHSQHPTLIEEVDFMQLDPETDEYEWQGQGQGLRRGYDIVSLSLVVNFVGDPRVRGEMLRHTVGFLRGSHSGVVGEGEVKKKQGDRQLKKQGERQLKKQGEREVNEQQGDNDGQELLLLPALFLVLPLPCVDNSRYLTEELLTAILEALGYQKTRVKRSGKLYYSLWRLSYPSRADDDNLDASVGEEKRRAVFKKQELRKGTDRNNFCIILDDAS